LIAEMWESLKKRLDAHSMVNYRKHIDG